VLHQQSLGFSGMPASMACAAGEDFAFRFDPPDGHAETAHSRTMSRTETFVLRFLYMIHTEVRAQAPRLLRGMYSSMYSCEFSCDGVE
jgi:hypothetical protein